MKNSTENVLRFPFRLRSLLCLLLSLLVLFSALPARAESKAEKIMRTYLETEITDDMTDLEKVIKITEIVARDYDYAYCSRWEKMVVQGGGDCWASTRFIVEACTRLGFTAYPNKEFDSNDMVLHRFAFVEVDGIPYICEAGFGGQKPRSYFVRPNYSLTYRGTYDREKGCYAVTAAQLALREEMDRTPSFSKIGILNQNNLEFRAVGDSFADGFVGVREFELADTITRIGSCAFRDNTALTAINIPSGLVEIGDEAFKNCAGLTALVFPSTMKTIGSKAFANCGQLTLTLPGSVDSIAEDAFEGTDVTLLVQPGSPARAYAVEHGLNWAYIYEDILTLPAGIKTVDEEALAGTPAAGIVIPVGAESIGSRAFANCPNLAWIIVPHTVSEIAEDAFEGIENLKILKPEDY